MVRKRTFADDWCSNSGKLSFKGKIYNLLKMSLEELRVLDDAVRRDREILYKLLKRKDLDEVEGDWRGETKELIKVRKMQRKALWVYLLKRANGPAGVKVGAVPTDIKSIQDSMCGTKVRHENVRSANEQIESMKANGKNTRNIQVYGPCPFCGYYHVGHKPKEVVWSKVVWA